MHQFQTTERAADSIEKSTLGARPHRLRPGRSAISARAIALWLIGCAEDEAAVPTYSEHVAPILTENCVECHRPGAIGPFPLRDYDEVVRVAAAVQRVTRARQMPPTLVDASGECGSYANTKWLSDEEIEMIRRWVDAGMPEGSGRPRTLEPPAATLTGPSLTVSMPEPYTPASRHGDEYRCFRVPLELDQDTFLTDFEAFPGNPRIACGSPASTTRATAPSPFCPGFGPPTRCVRSASWSQRPARSPEPRWLGRPALGRAAATHAPGLSSMDRARKRWSAPSRPAVLDPRR